MRAPVEPTRSKAGARSRRELRSGGLNVQLTLLRVNVLCWQDAVTNTTLCAVSVADGGIYMGTGVEAGNEAGYVTGFRICTWGAEDAPRFPRNHPIRISGLYSAARYIPGAMVVFKVMGHLPDVQTPAPHVSHSAARLRPGGATSEHDALLAPHQPTKSDGAYLLGPGGNAAAYTAFLQGENAATPSACLDDFTDAFGEACRNQFDTQKSRELEALLASCAWQEESTEQTNLEILHAPGGAGFSAAQVVAPSEYAIARCLPGAAGVGEQNGAAASAHGSSEQQQDDAWEFIRLGPFSTTGGYSWTDLHTCDALAMLFQHDSWDTSACLATNETAFSAAYDAFDACLQDATTSPMACLDEANAVFSPLGCPLAQPPPCFNYSKADVFPGIGKQWVWPSGPGGGGKRVLAVSSYFLGSVDAQSMKLLDYPPLHQHHFHAEAYSKQHPLGNGQGDNLITHGDDQCVASAGSAACEIRRMPAGYAQLVDLPLDITAIVNDVRATGSAPARWYQLIALKGRPHDGSRKSFSQARLAFFPAVMEMGGFGTYLVPSDQTSAYWREGTFIADAPVLWAYYHTHPAWMEEMVMYVGANSSQLDMESIGISGGAISTGLPREQLDASKTLLEKRAAAAGAQLVCHYKRGSYHLEVPDEPTAEIADHFYRKLNSCVPFQMSVGLPFLAVMITSPDSDAAATFHGYEAEPDALVAGVHSYVRLFTHLEGEAEKCCVQPMCDQGCTYNYI